MKKILLFIFLSAVQSQAADRYANPTGSGSTCTNGVPCSLQTALSSSAPGDRVLLQNGSYTGCEDMLDPPSNLNGTAGNRITVLAINPGQVLIDGSSLTWLTSCGGTYQSPIHLEDNDYWIVEDINAVAGSNSDSDTLEFGSGASNNIVRRGCFWDASIDLNAAIVWNYGTGANNNLVEDICVFGTGRKLITNGQSGDSNFTVRRAFAVWMKTTDTVHGGPEVFESMYKSKHGIFENVIGTIEAVDNGGVPGGADIAILGRAWNNSFGSPNDVCSNDSYYGSIAYIRAAASLPTGGTLDKIELYEDNQYIDCTKGQDIVVYSGQGSGTLDIYPAFLVDTSCALDTETGFFYQCPTFTRTYADTTEICNGCEASLLGNSFTISDRAVGTTVGAVPNIWNGAGTSGARICFRYENGTLTQTPLFENGLWPMNQRIIDAMTTAGYTPINVTTTLEGIFGTIPLECGGNDPGPIGPPPDPVTPVGIRARMRAR